MLRVYRISWDKLNKGPRTLCLAWSPPPQPGWSQVKVLCLGPASPCHQSQGSCPGCPHSRQQRPFSPAWLEGWRQVRPLNADTTHEEFIATAHLFPFHSGFCFFSLLRELHCLTARLKKPQLLNTHGCSSDRIKAQTGSMGHPDGVSRAGHWQDMLTS